MPLNRHLPHQRPPEAASGYVGQAPAAPLNAFVALLWTSARPAGLLHAREWNLPTGRADLVLPLDRPALRRFDPAGDAQGRWLAGGVLQGAMDRPTLRDTASASIVVGAQFHAAGLAGLLGMPADELAGRSLALDDVWPGWAARLRQCVLDSGALHQPQQRLAWLQQGLLQRLAGSGRAEMPGQTPSTDPMVLWALKQLADGQPVGAVQRASGCSPTTFIRRFRAATGLAPQRHLALLRFNAALALAHQGQRWVDVAADAGYADQAHLSRELRRFAGVSPVRLRAQGTPWTHHLAWG